MERPLYLLRIGFQKANEPVIIGQQERRNFLVEDKPTAALLVFQTKLQTPPGMKIVKEFYYVDLKNLKIIPDITPELVIKAEGGN